MIAENISTYLKSNGIKQSHVAESVGLHRQTFYSVMRGERRLTADEYVAICRALGKSTEYFVDKAS